MHKIRTNALVIDLEFWYNSEYLKGITIDKEEDDQLPESVAPLLELLDKYELKATFCVLGMVAEKYPEMVKSIFDQGHEIASHGYSHQRLHELGPEEFDKEIAKSIAILTSITGERPIGFRAPSFSLDNSTRWALPILQKHGFKYDASIFPVRTNLYGVPQAPVDPYRPSYEDITKKSQNGGIVEFPMTVFKLGINIPVAGGFYLRVTPFWVLKFALKRIEQNKPLIIYIHPWETYNETPRLLDLSYFAKFVTYYGINKTMGKLEQLLSEFKFNPIKKVLIEGRLI